MGSDPPPAAALHLHSVDRSDHLVFVEVKGELRAETNPRWPALMRGIVEQRAEGMTVDLRGCRNIDADCLEDLLAAAATMKARGGSGAALVLLPGSELAQRLRSLSDERTLIYASVDAAVRALGTRKMPIPSVMRLEQEAGVTIIAVNGEFDLVAKADFQEKLDKALALETPLIVDLEHCQFIDTTGIAQIVRSFELAADRGFGLVASGPQVHRVLPLVGIPDYLPSFDSREDALRAFTG